MAKARRDYKAYLLRLWRDKPESPWRAALENPNSGERIAFATLVELVLFIEEMTGEQIRPTPSEPAPAPFNKE
jgi:hypothetical protein